MSHGHKDPILPFELAQNSPKQQKTQVCIKKFASMSYSKDWNKRKVWNKRIGGKILKK